MMERVCHCKLKFMRENFANPEYIQARKQFFHKVKPTATPWHFTMNQYRPPHIFEGGNEAPSREIQTYSAALYMKGGKVSKLRMKHT